MHDDNRSYYIRGIDGLRALAVLAVMVFHIDPAWLPGGFSGVDVFFVISGYVVSASLARDAELSLLRFTLGFYARRIVRIFPALIVCLLITSLVTDFFVPASWLSNTSYKTGFFAFFGLSNFALVWFNDGYFSPRMEFNAFTHTWSLGVEEQFYVIFPLIFFVWMNYRKQQGVRAVLVNGLLPFLLLLSLAYSYYETTVRPDFAFYLLPSRFWELACGAFLFKLHSRQRFIPASRSSEALTLVAGLLLVSAGFVLSDKQAFPFPWALSAVFGSVFLIAGMVGHSDGKPLIKRMFENTVLVYVGKISYSLYLWHWPVYVLLRWTVGLETVPEIGAALVMSGTLAVLSYHFVERRLSNAVKSMPRPDWHIVSAGLATIVFASLLSVVIYVSQPVISLSVTKNRWIWYPNEWPAKVRGVESKALEGHRLFVIGDSHVESYATMLQKLVDESGVEVIKITTAGCGVVNLLRPYLADNTRCGNKIEQQLRNIEASASPGDIVFLASLRMIRLSNQWGTYSGGVVHNAMYGEKAIVDRQLALGEAEQLLNRFARLGVHIIIDAPMPVFKSSPFRCSDWFNRSNPACLEGNTLGRDFLLEHRRPVMRSLDSLVNEFPDLVVWDPFPILCHRAVCSSFDKQIPLFFDGDHLSAHGNRVLYPSFRALVLRIWAGKVGDSGGTGVVP